MKTMNDGAAAAEDDARPTRDDLARYSRAYRLSTKHARMFPMWQAALAHALLLDHDDDDMHEGYAGLNGRQLAEGARAMARTFALLIAEAPARNEQELERKIEIYQTMSFLPGEMERSRTAYMVEVAMHADASALGIALRKMPYDAGPGGVQ
ncbi:conserved hypothetical protein [Hyphomicrobiales bacterium]|nr:conserved hypothetical protein [Hyphomicrobiales bacterium]CAH1701471.1 conserved hypothetical protein [Hyphomicrobiales bacterium]CAI0345428.1 conserved hypothetical protein [Hyphomicrobiales bacterium]